MYMCMCQGWVTVLKTKHFLCSAWCFQVLDLLKYWVLQLYKYFLTTVYAMNKLFVLFFSAQDDESTDVNCLVF